MSKLWTEIKVGNMTLPHRLAMAPMTRSRALANGVPGELAAEYYGQRANLGLIISEGTQPSDDGQGYINTPGIYTEAHIEGWKKVTSRVHEEGGHIFIQLMHVGRISHPNNTPHHRQPVAPSAITPQVEMFTAEGMREAPTPRALSKDEINEVIQEFRAAASAAIEAGADGVEIHGANGYLIQQFLSANSNQRHDAYGSTIENRARFAIEVTKAVVDEIGADKTGFRISPSSTLHDIDEGEFGPDVYRFLIAELEKLDLAYLHVMHVGNETLLQEIRQIWSNPLLVNRAGRPLEQLTTDLDNDLADVVPVGSWALANPDFVERIKNNAQLNEADRNTFYGGGAEGYTDYPFLSKQGGTKMNKPYVIIHTHTSIDGNLDIMDLREFEEASRQYQELALDADKQQFGIQGYLNGKTTTEDNMTFYKKPVLDENAAPVPEGDYVAAPNAPMYYLSIDPRGELAFEENTFGYGGIASHIVEVLTEQASNAYKDFLRKKKISYIIAGKDQIDYEVMLDKFYNLFDIKRMMVGGGGTMNWSFIQNGLVDEVSVILAPIANGDPDGHRFFAAKEPYSNIKETAFQLKSVEKLEHDTLWIRYSVK